MIINLAGGNGIMGKVHAPIFENAGNKVIISGRKTSPNLEEAAQIADLTIISVPISATEEIIRKVAPHSAALMDFTGVKTLPIEWMLENSNESCEVGGLHPLYGDINSIRERSIVYCSTYRSGNKCQEILRCFEKEGAKIFTMDEEVHDRVVVGELQNARINLIESFGMGLYSSGKSFKETYRVSPPPTKVILNLLARQISESNDLLYEDMRKYNPFQSLIDKKFYSKEHTIKNISESSKILRTWYGDDLKICQERARKFTELV